MGERFPFPDFPDGWFQVAYGHDVAPGEVRSLHYFGEQLICFRDTAGVAHVLDAYCPHQGADIGVGGTVEGGLRESARSTVGCSTPRAPTRTSPTRVR